MEEVRPVRVGLLLVRGRGQDGSVKGFWPAVAFVTAAVAMVVLVVGCGGGVGQSPTGSTGVGVPATQSSGGPAQASDIKSQTTRVPVDGGGSYLDVSVAGLVAMLKSKDFPMINVHVPYEGEIEPTDAFIPYTDVERNLNKLPADKAAKIVLYCRSGSMSATAARVLAMRGYTNVYNLDGGMIAWKAAGHPIADKTR